MFKKKYFAFFFLSVLALFPRNVFALETIYPKLPWLPEITKFSSIGQYVSYFFGLAIIITGFTALVSFTIGAITYIASAGNPSVIGDAKDRMKGALIGLILLITSFLIIQTINPAIVQTVVGSLPTADGIYYYKSDTEMSPAQMEISDTSSAVLGGYENIYYKCSLGYDLIVWKYPKKNFDLPKINDSLDYSKVTMAIVPCGQKTDITSALSIKMSYKTAGVYYFLGESCSGFMSTAKTSGDASLPEPFKGRLKSVAIINYNSFYGVIVHKNENFAGGCSTPIFESSCTNVTSQTAETLASQKNSFSSTTIFQINADYNSSGSGVTFYSLPYGNKTGTNSGFFEVKKNDAQFQDNYWDNNADTDSTTRLKKFYWKKKAENIKFTFPKKNTLDPAKCSSFKSCPGSLEINGKYLVLLAAKGEYSTGGQYKNCQLFTKTAPNLKWETFIASGSSPDFVQIWPIK